MTYPILETAIRAALFGANELLSRRNSITVREKAPKDLVTDADLASQEVIFQILGNAFPQEPCVGEEQTASNTLNTENPELGYGIPCWIIDPLDGTVNYVHRLQSFCVSIARMENGELHTGVVFDPICDELYTAQKGKGAYISRGDGSRRRRLKTSNCKSLDKAMVACSFPAGVRRDAVEVAQFLSVLEACRTLRRLGSCALNLCYVAAGRLDGYWTQSVKPWDMAAGALIVQEAGGIVQRINGETLDVWAADFIATSTDALQTTLRATLHSSNH